MNMRHKNIITGILVTCFLSLLLASCDDKPKADNEFLEKWRLMADQSQGHSPSEKTRRMTYTTGEEATLDIIGGEKEPEKPLPAVPVSMDYRDANLIAVLQALAKHVGISLMISPNVTGSVTVNIDKQPWGEVFKGLLRTNGLSYTWEGDIIRVLTVDDMNVDLAIQNVKIDQQVAAAMEMETEEKKTAVIDIKYQDSCELVITLAGLLFSEVDDEESHKGRWIWCDEETNSLIVSAPVSQMEKAFALISKLDRPRSQIKIKGHIVEANDDTARDLGVQWGGNYLYRAPQGSGRFDDDHLQVYSGTQGWTSGGNRLTTDANLDTATNPGGTASSNWAINLPADISAAGLATGLVYGTIGADLLEMQLTALSDENLVNILLSPSITTMDNEMAYTETGREVPYASLDEAGNTIIEYKDVVLRLEITPHIIDNEYLRLKILVKNDSLTNQTAAGGQPILNKSMTETTLIARDNETVVISGLSYQESTDQEQGVPGIKDIPLVGWLFKRQANSAESRDILIFITPTILDEWKPGEVQKSLDEIESDMRRDKNPPEEEEGGENGTE